MSNGVNDDGQSNNDSMSEKEATNTKSVVEDIYGERSPFLNFQKKSLLFDTSTPDEISTKGRKNNNNNPSPFQILWQGAKSTLPPIVTGVYDTKTTKNGEEEENPAAKLYNLCFVRIPTIIAGFVYIKNELSGHPFTIDFGFYDVGPIDVPPIIVLGLLGWILR